jgi:hypothetical protein
VELDREQLIHSLEQTYSNLVQLTSALDDGALDFHPSTDQWSIREILAHLVDDEMFVMRTRLERIAKEEHPHLAPHDEKKWYATRNTSRDALAELLADFNLQRAASLGIMRMLRDTDWARQGYQPEYGHFTAEQWLTHWVAHDTTHIQQIQSNLTARGQIT